MDLPMSITKEVRHYVVRNVVATLGMSMYVIIDTLFISIAAGALGLTTLNLVLPYSTFLMELDYYWESEVRQSFR